MNAATINKAPNILVISTHASFRAHVQKWLPAPGFNLIDANAENLSVRVREFPPQLLILDREMEDIRHLLSRLAALVPGLPYIIISTKRLDPANPFLFDIASGFVDKENETPSRDSIISTIAKIAPGLVARVP